MATNTVFEMLCGTIGGLFIFLLGMRHMSDGIQSMAGTRLRRMINAVTDNRLGACGIGIAVTSIIQSSSVTSVMVIGLVNAGIMTLAQAVGVILGADIGTTVTAWIVSLNITEYGLPILGLAGFFYLFSKQERWRNAGMMVMGIGMIFFGLELMKLGVGPLRDYPGFVDFLVRFRPNTLGGLISCVIAGATLTALIQSSSATIAITITLARTGAIDFTTAAALVLGENIGTTITAFLASIGATPSAKRTAYAHILIKVIGVSLIIPLFPYFIRLVNSLVGPGLEIAKRIAFTHTLFNIILVSIFLPSVALIVGLLYRIYPKKDEDKAQTQTFLDSRLVDTPAIAIEHSFEEIRRMSQSVEQMMLWLRDSLDHQNNSATLKDKIYQEEEKLDVVQKEIVEFLGELLVGNTSPTVSVEAHKQFRLADEYESISDYIRTLSKLLKKMHSSEFPIHANDESNLHQLHADVNLYLQGINRWLMDGGQDRLPEAVSGSERINSLFKQARREHLDRIQKNSVKPLSSLVFVDILQSYRKVKGHTLNIAEALSGEK